jgi:mannobiose 2-epimerase
LDNQIAKVIDSQDKYLRHLTDGVMAFWIEHGPDVGHGGFYGGLDRKGNSIPSLPKGLVQHARFLWSFSAAYRFDPQPAYHELADRSFNFLRECFYDPARLGWYYLVSAEGLPLNKQKHLYGQSFAIYGLSEYSLAFGNEEALRLALETFNVIDEFGHDSQWRGYKESFSEEWNPIPQHPDYGVSGNRKTMNTHIHLLESFTNLYRASQDATVKNRLEELIDLCVNTITDTKRGCALQFFEPDWTPLPSPVSYGHDVELSWLLTEAGDVCKISDVGSIHGCSLSLARGVARNGLDRENGGVFYEGDERGRATGKQKVWWVQAEALVGFLNAYALSGDDSFIDAFSNVERWVFARQFDEEYSEWHQEITPEGEWRGEKGSIWKTSYHTARACIEIVRRLSRLQIPAEAATTAHSEPAEGPPNCGHGSPMALTFQTARG